MLLLAPAKINLHLRVGPTRPDGFHPLLSWMCTVGLFDNLTLQRTSSAGVVLACSQPDLPCDQRNLVVRIANSLAEMIAANRDWRGTANVGGVSAVLEKRIPVGAGLGGGSSDGARALLGFARLWNLPWSNSQLSDFAARFGSDLSFFFHQPSAICSGRGERVCPIAAPKPRWAVLILPSLSMPTPPVYRRFDELALGHPDNILHEPDWNQWLNLDAEPLLARLVNDLEPAAFSIAPELGQLRQGIEQTLSRIVRMSGSGSSLFTLFDSQSSAVAAADNVQRRHRVSALAVPLAPLLRDDLADATSSGQ